MAHVHFETVLALLLALASTTLVSLAYLREQAAVQELPALSLAHPGASLRGLLTSRPWLVGFLMEGGGFALYVAALALGPLALVQSVGAGGSGRRGGAAGSRGLAVVPAGMSHRRLARRDRLGAGLAVTGLLFLSLSL